MWSHSDPTNESTGVNRNCHEILLFYKWLCDQALRAGLHQLKWPNLNETIFHMLKLIFLILKPQLSLSQAIFAFLGVILFLHR